MNYNQPPPPQQQYQPPPPTNNAVSTGKTPIARRTRSSKLNNNNTQKTVGPPPQYNTAPPPPTNNTTTTTKLPSSMYNPKLSGYESLNVNDAIAKRRAELRHLQQRQRDNGTLTNVARNKLSQGGNVNNSYGYGANNHGVGVNNIQPPSANNNNKPPFTQNIQQNKPASNYLNMPLPPQPQTNNNQTNTMQVPTPPVARRLDNSYGVEQHRAPLPQSRKYEEINPNNNNNNNLAINSNINDNVPPMRSDSYQEQRRSSSTASSSRPGNQKRDSEIFNAGKMKLHQQVGSHNTTRQFSSERENSSTMMSGFTTEASSGNSANQEQRSRSSSITKSPFGQARTILSVKQGDNPMLGVPPFQPPPLTTFNTNNMPADDVIEDENEDLLQNNIMPPSKKISPTASGSSVALKLGDRLVGEVDSGSSTPIMSNSFDEADNHIDNPTSSTQSVTAAAAAAASTTLNNNRNMSRLMSDLQRTEREKAEALDQVNKLRLLLATNHTNNTANNEQQQLPTSTAANTTSGNNTTMPSSSSSELLNQFRGMVTRQGASAAVDWMSKQLENAGSTPDSSLSSGGLRSSPETPLRRPPLSSTRGASLNYAGDSELPLSSNIPPLTPRSSSRPGSRAASPERSSTRGKRITTPLPKKLKASNDSLDGMVTNNSGGDITSHQQHQQSDDNSSPGIEQEYLTKASKCIPNEYGTMLASYIVRRPYITSNGTSSTNSTYTTNTNSNNNSNNSIEEEEFLQYKQLSNKSTYLNEATVLNPNTLEVIAYIEADNSILTLSGISNVCHGYNTTGHSGSGSGGNGGGNSNGDWTTFDNVEENDIALGKVTYIDVDGNECDYWLGTSFRLFKLCVCIWGLPPALDSSTHPRLSSSHCTPFNT